MKRPRSFLQAAAAIVAATGIATADAQLLPPRGGPLPPAASTAPADPHEQLAFFEGNWQIIGLGGEQFAESCTWLSAERRHIVCRARTQTTTGLQDSMSVLSYRPADATYLYHSFAADGSIFTMQGTRTGNAWQFYSDEGSGSARRRTRMTILPGGERSFVVQQETALGNGPFQRDQDVRYVPAPR